MADPIPYDLFAQAGFNSNVDPLLLQAIAQVESGNRNTDANGRPLISSAGAKGRMQFIDSTGQRYGVTNPFDDAQSIPGAAQYISDLLSQSRENVVQALRLYNGGGDPNYAGKVIGEWQRLRAQAQSANAAPSPTAQPQAQAQATAAPDDSFWSNLGADAKTAQPPAKAPEPPPSAAPQTPSTAPSPAPASPAAPDDDWWNTLGTNPAARVPQPGEIDPLTGQPVQSLNAADEKNPVVQSLGKPTDESRAPSLTTQAIASLPADPEAKRRILAARLFPNLPLQEAESRIFTDASGRLAAVDDNGNPYAIEPKPVLGSVLSPPTSPFEESPVLGAARGDTSAFRPSNLLQATAASAGGALPTIGGAIGAAATGPGSLVVGPVSAAAGGALGDLVRQYLAKQFDPQGASVSYDPVQIAQEALTSGVGAFGGSLLNRWIAPNALRIPVSDINIARSAPFLDNANTAMARANAQGVDLTPGQASGLRSLLQHEDAAMQRPGTVDIAADFYRNQGNQLQNAAQDMLGNISSADNKTDGALQFQQGADDAIRMARQNANAAARPDYQAAQATLAMPTPALQALAERPAIQEAWEGAQRLAANEGRQLPSVMAVMPDGQTVRIIHPDFEAFDYMKRALDDQVNNATGNERRVLSDLRSQFVEQLDQMYPTYAQARATAAPGQRLAQRLEDSGTGTTAGGTGAERARSIVNPVFNQNPRAISEARDAYIAANREDEWNAGVRAYLQDAIDRASMSQQGLNPSMLLRNVWNNQDTRAAMQSAMTPQQFQGFENFMGTIEDVARTFPMNSLTDMRKNAGAALDAAGANNPISRATAIGANVVSPWRLPDIGAKGLDAINRWAQGRTVQSIVNNLFSPDGLRYLQAMSRVSPRSQQAIELTGQLVARVATQIGSDVSAATAGPQQQQTGQNKLQAPAGSPSTPTGP